jgi:class 3 adenylate cyclase
MQVGAICLDPGTRPRSSLAGASVSRARSLKRSRLTLLFTDIVESTQTVERLGDEAWLTLHTRHDALVRARLARFGGREITSTGDGFFAVFQAPAAGIHCAVEIRQSLQKLGLRIRCGLHTSECLVSGYEVSGLAVHIAARIAAAARPNEILVSRVVKEQAADIDVEFVDGHLQALRGVSNEHELFTVQACSRGAAKARRAG